jgi:hypothetical protein
VKALRTQNFTAYVGLDWADAKHDICLQAAGSDQREFACVAHQVECIDEWAKSLQQRFSGPIAIALELAKIQSTRLAGVRRFNNHSDPHTRDSTSAMAAPSNHTIDTVSIKGMRPYTSIRARIIVA